MSKSEYEAGLARLAELQNIGDSDPRCGEFNQLLDDLIDYEDENNIYVTRT